ncbi:hypothetical protein niasHT_003259 [Heterodera trifolii]|uniref:Uncharacterized protein n=1 Tax=Heterodera trifolii TaxID=157864 RepID=A0ABD2LQT6_9BILA
MRNRPRNTIGEIAEVRFAPLEEVERPDRVLERLVQRVFDRVLDGRPAPMLIGLQLHPPTFENPFTIPLRPPEQNNPAAIADLIQRLNDQSAAGIDLTGGTTVTKVLAVWPMQSDQSESGRAGACSLDEEHRLVNTVRSLIRIKNPNDRLCLARAVLLGLHDWRSRSPGGGGPTAFKSYANRQHTHGPEARNLLRRAAIPRNKHMYTIDDVQKLQNWIDQRYGPGEIRIAVFEKEREYRIVFKAASGEAAKFNLCLLFENQHFNYIGRIEQMFRVQGYCIDCERRVTRWYHPQECKVVCRLCLRFGAGYPCKQQQQSQEDGSTGNRLCRDCQFVFPNDDCFAYHLSNRAPSSMYNQGGRTFRPICEWRRACRQCGAITYANYPHKCPAQIGQTGWMRCARCFGPHQSGDPCFIQPLKDEPTRRRRGRGRQQQQQNNDDEDDADNGNEEGDDGHGADDEEEEDGTNGSVRLCFFDAETSQDLPLQLRTKVVQKHVPMLIIAEIICEACINEGISVHSGAGQYANGCVCVVLLRGQGDVAGVLLRFCMHLGMAVLYQPMSTTTHEDCFSIVLTTRPTMIRLTILSTFSPEVAHMVLKQFVYHTMAENTTFI